MRPMGAQTHLEQDLDEDAGGGGGVVLSQADALQDLPADGVLLQQRPKELGHVAQLVGLQAVDQRVLPAEALLKALLVGREFDREARRQQGVVPAGEASFRAPGLASIMAVAGSIPEAITARGKAMRGT